MAEHSATIVPFRRLKKRQPDLFGEPKSVVVKLEVHEHTFISGSRTGQTLVHSHADGDKPHRHENTGPSCYAIDKDEWFRATGMRGGSCKKFTGSPTGEQLPATPADTTFEIIVCDPPAPPGFKGSGGGLHAAARMMQAFNLTPVVQLPPNKGRDHG